MNKAWALQAKAKLDTTLFLNMLKEVAIKLKRLLSNNIMIDFLANR